MNGDLLQVYQLMPEHMCHWMLQIPLDGQNNLSFSFSSENV